MSRGIRLSNRWGAYLTSARAQDRFTQTPPRPFAVLVALWWLIPDRRIERVLSEAEAKEAAAVS